MARCGENMSKKKIIILFCLLVIAILISILLFSQHIFVKNKAVDPNVWSYVIAPENNIELVYEYRSNGFPFAPGYTQHFIFRGTEPGEVKIAWFYSDGDYVIENQSYVSIYNINKLMCFKQIATDISIKDADVPDFDNVVINYRIAALKRFVDDYAKQENLYCTAEISYNQQTSSVNCIIKTSDESTYEEFKTLIDEYLTKYISDQRSVMSEISYDVNNYYN
jgi:hypothetical protein